MIALPPRSIHNTIVIACDPGITGALAGISLSGRFIFGIRTPVRMDGKGKKQVDEAGCRRVISRNRKGFAYVLFALELVQSTPNDGRVGAFRFGANYGFWRGLATGMKLEFVEYRPQKWQKGTIPLAPTGKEKKEYAVSVARKKFPEVQIKYKLDWGIADALLLGEFARIQKLKEMKHGQN